MCGIVGYIGKKQAQDLLIEGLRRLEYRGYDSAGICTLSGGDLHVRKKSGRIDALAGVLKKSPAVGSLGICHTRWATHGAPTDYNAHPHLDQSGKLALVHNGVIENYQAIKNRLTAGGHTFTSSTDTEVLAHLVGEHLEKLRDEIGSTGVPARENQNGDAALLVEAVRRAVKEVIGTYGIGVVHSDYPNVMVGARRGSPLIVGVGRGENFLASDVTALIAHTRDVVYLKDNEIALLTEGDFQVFSLDAESVEAQISQVEFGAGATEKGDYPHYMLKEIYEQPQVIQNALRGRVDTDTATAKLGGLNLTAEELRSVDRVIFAACGTAWHSALIGEYLIEELARVPCEVEYASEFRYRNPPMDSNTVVFVISQSGETADTLAALREAQRKGHKALGIVNVVGSTIAREVDGGIYMHAGPEIGVAATKSFTSQVTILTLLALHLARLRHMSTMQGAAIIRELEMIPSKIERALKCDEQVREIAKKYHKKDDFLFLGRQFNFPIALEGALKLKEISYIHAEGYPSAEMKHGPIALIDEDTPSVFLCPKDSVYEKVMSNIEEVKARKGPVIAIATEDDTEIAHKADDVIYVPPTLEFLQPLLTVIPLQLLAYHIAVLRGCDVDKPRNLAKSVTVE